MAAREKHQGSRKESLSHEDRTERKPRGGPRDKMYPKSQLVSYFPTAVLLHIVKFTHSSLGDIQIYAITL